VRHGHNSFAPSVEGGYPGGGVEIPSLGMEDDFREYCSRRFDGDKGVRGRLRCNLQQGESQEERSCYPGEIGGEKNRPGKSDGEKNRQQQSPDKKINDQQEEITLPD